MHRNVSKFKYSEEYCCAGNKSVADLTHLRVYVAEGLVVNSSGELQRKGHEGAPLDLEGDSVQLVRSLQGPDYSLLRSL